MSILPHFAISTIGRGTDWWCVACAVDQCLCARLVTGSPFSVDQMMFSDGLVVFSGHLNH